MVGCGGIVGLLGGHESHDAEACKVVVATTGNLTTSIEIKSDV
jgi:hypothetical protein